MLKPMHEEHLPWAFRIAAFPRPAPEPWFLFFMLFNMGAFFSMSGKIKKRILLPRMYTCSSCATRPSLYVTVMLDIWKGITTSSSVRANRVSGAKGHRERVLAAGREVQKCRNWSQEIKEPPGKARECKYLLWAPGTVLSTVHIWSSLDP